jgi:hypothetical protein
MVWLNDAPAHSPECPAIRDAAAAIFEKSVESMMRAHVGIARIAADALRPGDGRDHDTSADKYIRNHRTTAYPACHPNNSQTEQPSPQALADDMLANLNEVRRKKAEQEKTVEQSYPATDNHPLRDTPFLGSISKGWLPNRTPALEAPDVANVAPRCPSCGGPLIGVPWQPEYPYYDHVVTCGRTSSIRPTC